MRSCYRPRFPGPVAGKIAAPDRATTSAAYDSKWTIWCDWCHTRQFILCDPSVVNLYCFFTDQPANSASEAWCIPPLTKLVGREDDRLLCSVRALRWYLDRTSCDSRHGPDSQLFLPLDPAVPSTTPNMVSRLLCNVIFRAYLSDDARPTQTMYVLLHTKYGPWQLRGRRLTASLWKMYSARLHGRMLPPSLPTTSGICATKGRPLFLGPIVAAQQVITTKTNYLLCIGPFP